MSPRPPLPRKVGVMTPQLLWERRPWAAVRENGDFVTVVYNFITFVNYTIFAAIIDSFMSN